MASDLPEIPQAIGGLPPTQPTLASTTTLNAANNLDAQFYRTWQPTGIRIAIKLPYISDDKTPLFAVRVTPRVGYIATRQIPSVGQVCGLGYTNPIVYPSCGVSRQSFTFADEPVVATIYDTAGPFNKIAHMYRYYKGSINYRFRCVTNCVAQGYVMFGVVHGATADIIRKSAPSGVPNICSYLVRRVWETGRSVKAGMMNTYQLTDLSQLRHVEVQVPFISNTEFRDMQWMDCVASSVIDDGQEFMAINQPQSFIVAYARGELTSFSGSQATLIYELEYCPGPDFEFFNELPLTAATLFRTNFDEYRQISSSYYLPFSYPGRTATFQAQEEDENQNDPQLVNTVKATKYTDAERNEGLALRMNAMTLARNVAKRSSQVKE